MGDVPLNLEMAQQIIRISDSYAKVHRVPADEMAAALMPEFVQQALSA